MKKAISSTRLKVVLSLVALLSCVAILLPSSAFAAPNYNYCGTGTYRTAISPINGYYETVFQYEYWNTYPYINNHVYIDYRFTPHWTVFGVYYTKNYLAQRTKNCT
jgi:hypothetical protein